MKSTWWSFRGQTTGQIGAAPDFQAIHRQKSANHAAASQLSENSDIQTETASRRDSLSLLHKFARCAKRRQSLFPCPLAALRGVGSQIVVSPAQSWMANSTESFRRKGTASIAYIPARKAISYGKMVILWTFASSSDKGAFPSAPLKREYGEAVD